MKPLEAFAKAKRGLYGRNSRCKTCKQALSKAWREKNPDHKQEYQRIWHENNRERVSAYRKDRYARHAESERAYMRDYKAANRDRYTAHENRRRAAELNQTLAGDFEREIQQLFSEAARLTRETGIPHNVDHIVPLQGREMRGLHVPWNLRVIPASENFQKKNRVDPTLAVPACFEGRTA